MTGSSVDAKAGCVWLSVSPDQKNWINGVPVKAKKDSCFDVRLKPGDTLVTAEGMAYWEVKPIAARTFESYHVESISGKGAWITHNTYAVRTVPNGHEGIRIFPGKLLKSSRGSFGAPTDVPIVDGGEWDGIYPVGYHLGQSARTK